MIRRSLFLLTFLAACASTKGPEIRYDESEGITSFSSEKMLIGRVDMGRGLASGQRVTMQALAACEGNPCEPHSYELAFLNDGSADLNLDYRRVRVTFDGHELSWEDLGRFDEPEHYAVPRGEFIRVPISASNFRQLARAQQVEFFFGLTGTTSFAVPQNRLTPLSELLSASES